MAQLNSQERCDVVLEGGVTSAVIYAGLLATLSKTYRYKNLGGTSAGAVAAAAAAIAELARRSGHGDAGFVQLGKLSADLGTTDDFNRTKLFKLFQPHAKVQRGYGVLIEVLRRGKPGRWTGAVIAGLWASVVAFHWAALAGLLVGLLPVVHHGVAAAACRMVCESGAILALGALVAAALGVLFAAAWGVWTTLRGALGNHFGLCSGMPVAGQYGDALTPLLHQLYNGLAGLKPEQPPVVFAMLWNAPDPDGLDVPDQRAINLQMITTALNLKRPIRLPNEPGVDPLRAFFYDPAEWATLFPEPVMAWLAEHPRDGGTLSVTSRDGRALRALPEPGLWPVVMAVRLSLSFPGLLSAVPMYTLDGPRGVHKRPGMPGAVCFEADKVYFSDGGITSNCPIQLFDAPLPKWPTFGVNLVGLSGEHHSEPKVWMSGDPVDATLQPHPFNSSSTLTAAIGFVSAIVGTALDWRDAVQRELPGYRERIVHIGVPPNQGGLNLTMTAADIETLDKAGRDAAARLVQEFKRPRTAAERHPNGWDLHRWLRMRSTLAATRRHLGLLRDSVTEGAPPYRTLPCVGPALTPRFIDADAAEQAQRLMDCSIELLAAVDGDAPAPPLADNAPEPAPTLRMSSPW